MVNVMKKLFYIFLISILFIIAPLNAYAQNIENEATTVNVTETSEETTTDAEAETTTAVSDEEETTTEPEQETTTVPSEETTTAPSEEETTLPSEDETTEPDDEPSTEPSDDPPFEEKPVESIVSLNGKKIMLVGNSMLYYGNCVINGNRGEEDYGYFYQLIASNNEKATVIDHTYPGKKLDYIYENYLVKLSKSELSSYDYVVLSEAKQVNNDLLGTCEKIMALFPEKTQFRFMCHPMMYDENVTSLLNGVAILRENDFEIVDWGKMVYDIYTGAVQVPGATMKFDRCSFIKENKGYINGTGSIGAGGSGDNKHPNPLSGYVSAQMLYTSITNRSAVLSDYSFCSDTTIHKNFDIDAFASAHYTGTKTTNFNRIFRSHQDMIGLQTLIDTYLEAEGRHPLVIEEAVNPTCTSGGLTEGYYCSVCGLVVKSQEYIKSFGGHTLVYDKSNLATCKSVGKTAGIHCSVCKKVLVAQKSIAKLPHNTKYVITAATTSKNGTKASVCTDCNKTVSTEKIYKIKSVELSKTSYVCNGKNKTPSVTVKDSAGKVLKKDVNYTLTYPSEAKAVGKYTVTVKFKNSHKGSQKLTFKILPGTTEKISFKSYLKSVKLSWQAVEGATGYRIYMYNSKTKKYKKLADVEGTSYKATKLSSGKTYKFRIKAFTKKGKTTYYSAKYKSVSVAAKPARAALTSVISNTTGQVRLNWKTVSGASGYQIVYSTSKKFKSVKKVTVNKQSKSSAAVKKLVKGKKYFFKIRAYRTVNGKNIYGAYSEVKSITVR